MSVLEVSLKNVCRRPIRTTLIIIIAAVGIASTAVLSASVSGALKSLEKYGMALNPNVIVVSGPTLPVSPKEVLKIPHVKLAYEALVTDALLYCNGKSAYVVLIGYPNLKYLKETTEVKVLKGNATGAMASPGLCTGKALLVLPFIGNKEIDVTAVAEFPMLRSVLHMPVVAARLSYLNITPNAVVVLVDSPSHVKYVLERLKRLLPPGSYVVSRESIASMVSAIASVADMLSTMVMVSIIVAVMLSTAVILYMEVRSRVWEVGLLKAIGFTSREVALVYLGEALFYSAAACAAGVPLALYSLSYAQKFMTEHLAAYGIKVVLSPAYVLPSTVAVVLSLVLGSVVPAAFAARVDPSQALRTIE